MTRESDSEPGGPLADARRSASALVGLCGLVAAPLHALTARLGTLGERYTGLPMFFGVVAQFALVGLAGGPTAGQQAGLLTGATLLVLALHRAKRASARRRWGRPNSMYTGVSRGWGSELALKGVTIPALALFAGLVVAGPLPGIGAWLIAASVGQAISVSAYRAELDARARALRDSRIDHEVLRQHEEGL